MHSGDRPGAQRILREFVAPLAGIRDRRKGYAVAIIKAGLRTVGRDQGPVRPPLVDLLNSEMEMLEQLVARTATLVAPAPRGRPAPARA
jgi:5-dehydro-4-deoxyglucarate dehydratase